VQSPHDPDATYGHKGKGYEVQIAETCGDGEPLRIATHASVNGAHESDTRATIPVIEALEAAGLKPDTLLALHRLRRRREHRRGRRARRGARRPRPGPQQVRRPL